MTIAVQVAMVLGSLGGALLVANGIDGLIKHRPFAACPRRKAGLFTMVLGGLAAFVALEAWRFESQHDVNWAVTLATCSVVVFAASRLLGRVVVLHWPADLTITQASGVSPDLCRPGAAESSSTVQKRIVSVRIVHRCIWPGLVRVADSAAGPQENCGNAQAALDELLAPLPRGTGAKYAILDLVIGGALLIGVVTALLVGGWAAA